MPEQALYEAGGEGQVYGDEPGFVRPMSVYTQAAIHPVIASVTAGLAIGIAAATAAWMMREPNRERWSPRRRRTGWLT